MGHPKGTWAVSALSSEFHETSGHFLTGGCDGCLRTWRFTNEDDGPSATVVRTFGKGDMPVVSVSASRDHDIAASVGMDGALKLWTLSADGIDPKTVQPPAISDGWAVSISHDGERVVTGGCNGVVQLIDSAVCLLEQTYSVTSDSTSITPATEDRPNPAKSRKEHPMVMSLMMRDDGERVLAGMADGGVVEFDVETGSMTSAKLSSRHGGPVRCVRYVRGERGAFVSASDDGFVNVYDIGSDHCTASLKGHDGMVFSADASVDGRFIVGGGSDQRVLVWDRAQQQVLYDAALHSDAVWGVSWAGADDRIVSVGDDEDIRILGCSRE